jgi:hypothetical protein
MPRLTSKTPKVAFDEAIRMSQQRLSSRPPAIAAPLSAAIVTFSQAASCAG